MRYVRAKLVWPSDPADTPYVFDLLLDANERIIGNWPIFGVSGGVRGDASYPFVLGSEDQIDYGVGCEGRYRFERTNLRERLIRIGEYVTIWNADDEEWAYRVQEIIDLTQLAQRHTPISADASH